MPADISRDCNLHYSHLDALERAQVTFQIG